MVEIKWRRPGCCCTAAGAVLVLVLVLSQLWAWQLGGNQQQTYNVEPFPPIRPHRYVKVAYVNFWPGFNSTQLLVCKGLANVCRERGCTLQVVDSPHVADLVISSVFTRFDLSNVSAVKVLLTLENIGMDGQGALIRRKLDLFDWVIGFHDGYEAGGRRIPSIRWPYYMEYICQDARGAALATAAQCVERFNYSSSVLRWPLEARNRSATLVARRDVPVGGPVPLFRSRVLEAFGRAGVAVRCPSLVGKNSPSLAELKLTKIEFQAQHVFAICPENSAGLGYVTEKLVAAVYARAIPVYFGTLLEEDRRFFNTKRILFIDPQDLDAVARHAAALLRDENALRDMFEQPAFARGAHLVLQNHIERLHEGLAEIVVGALERHRSGSGLA